MKISLNLTRDSDNSYPEATLDLEIFDKVVELKISDCEREVQVSKEVLVKILKILDECE